MTNTEKATTILLVLIASASLHAGMLATGYMQEDAFITFRTAFNLADFGIYSFNLTENYPGATSLFFGFFVALLRFIANDFAIVIIGLINICFVIAGGLLLTLSLNRSTILSCYRENTSFLVILFCATAGPALLKIGSSGMETALLYFMFCLSLWGLSRKNLYVLCFSLAFLPFVRIDSVGFCLILIMCLFFLNMRSGLVVALSFVTGIGLLLLANTFVFDSAVPLTAQAKSIAYSPDRSTLAILERFLKVIFTESFLLGISSKFIPSFVYTLTSFFFLLPVTFVIFRLYRSTIKFAWINYKKSNTFKHSSIKQGDLPLYVIAISTVLIPLAYSVGGVIFPWYLWPFSSLAFVLVTAFYLEKLPTKTSTFFSLIFIAFLAAYTLLININISEQESRYRSQIGRDINQISNPNDTLFLEPAGYIPFYAGITTYDTVGLTSSKVLKYHKKHKKEWWLKFVTTELPTFIVDRSPIHLNKTTSDGVYQLTDLEYAWFNENYILEKSYDYKKYLGDNKTTLYGIHRFGSSSSYYLYRRVGSYFERSYFDQSGTNLQAKDLHSELLSN